MSDNLIQKIKIVYEDDDILVVDKPAGLVINRSNTYKGDTLQDFVEAKFDFSEAVFGGDDFINRSGIVHRIDKDTSGIVVISKNREAFDNLLKQFKNREVEKEYIAVVHGSISEDKIEINAPIKRSPKSPLKFAVVAGGRESVTVIEKIKEVSINSHIYTMLKVSPKTGRTHQIRVHLSALGNYIVNDKMYCTNKLLEQGTEVSDRMMLHASKITFKHPKTGTRVEYKSKIPDDFSM
ncbi:RluA family pseudouridine synthase [Patescibacteria group bacterium]|nr:RluA family pseudouridine synthase [Patescibacteria group bacterium]